MAGREPASGTIRVPMVMASLVHASIEMTLTWSPGEAEMVTVASWPGRQGRRVEGERVFHPGHVSEGGCESGRLSRLGELLQTREVFRALGQQLGAAVVHDYYRRGQRLTRRHVADGQHELPASCASARWYVVRLVANMATSAAAISTKTALRDMTLPPDPMSYPFADPQHPTRSTTREPSRELRKKKEEGSLRSAENGGWA